MDAYWISAIVAVVTVTLTLCVAHKPGLLTRHPVALVIAHPDDEVMFFYPTLRAMPAKSVHLLCLSTGNADNLGDTRTEELRASCRAFPSIAVCDIRDTYQDGMDEQWDTAAIVRDIHAFILEHNLRVVFTFDEGGISGHPNHCSIATAAKSMVTRHQEHEEYEFAMAVFTLSSLPFWRKYIGATDVLITAWSGRSQYTLTNVNPVGMLFALMHHWTQMVWFRWFWCFLSRYSYVNSFKVFVAQPFRL